MTESGPGLSGPSMKGPSGQPGGAWRLTPRQWWAALRRCVRDFREDQLTDRAAGLTYYAVLSIFPGLLVLVSVLGLLGGPASGINELLGSIAPGQAGEVIQNGVDRIAATGGTAGLVAIAGLLVAFWSASGYVAAFLRTLNAIHDAPPERAKRALPKRLGLTAVVGVLLVICVFLVVVTGDLAQRTGEAIGLGSAAVTAWNIAKWPVLLVLVAVVIALLYRAGPHAEDRPRWISPGSLTAVLLWILVSALFGVYLSTVASYERTYGALSSAIIFLVWLWLTNMAVLLGAELDAELDRARRQARDRSPADASGDAPA